MTRRKKRRKDRTMHPTTGRDAAVKLRPVEVENPDWEPSKDGLPGFPRFIEGEKNTRESAVEILFDRGFLASVQKKAAEKFAAYYQAAGGRVSSLDYSLDRVDGGKGDPVVSRVIAAQELQRCRQLLGRRGFENVEAVCGEGRSLADLSPHKRERLTMADNLRADLDDLAAMWGIQTRRKRP